MQSSCPDKTTWEHFVDCESQGKITSPDLVNHLENCQSCKTKVHFLKQTWDHRALPNPTDQDDHSVEKILVFDPKMQSDPLPGLGELLSPETLADETPPESVLQIPGLRNMKEISRGGMGVVYTAIEEDLQRLVAVKILGLDTPLSSSARASALREAVILARIQHPQVVRIYRSGQINNLVYLVMEFVAGGTLEEWIKKNEATPRMAARVVRDLAEAVSEVHAVGIIHRDLKPDNVLLEPANNEAGFIPKLADFGVARWEWQESQGLTEVGKISGTPSFMAPEQTGLNPALGTVGPASDVHGLGAILYTLLTKKPPYEGFSSWVSLKFSSEGKYRPIQSLRQKVPRDLRTIVETCLKTEPRSRYRSAGILVDELQRFLDGRPITGRPVSPAERFGKWVWRHPVVSTMAMLLLLTLSGLVALAWTGANARQKSIQQLGALNQDLKYLNEKLEVNNKELAEANAKAMAALEQSKQSLSQLGIALGTVNNDVVSRMMDRGQPLNADDRLFLRRIRDQYIQWPLEGNRIKSHQYRAESLDRLADMFYKVDQYEDARQCHQDVLAECDAADKIDRDEEQQRKFNVLRISSLNKLYNCLERLGREQEAKQVAEQGIQEISTRFPADSLESLQLLRFYQIMAFIGIKENGGTDWQSYFEKGLQVASRVREHYPDSEDLWVNQLRFFYNFGIGYLKLNQIAGQQECFQTVYCLAGEGGEKFSKNWRFYRINEFRAFSGLIDSAEISKEPEIAREVVDQKVLDIEESLKVDPNDPTFIDALIETANQKFRICRQLNITESAGSLMQQAVLRANKRYEEEPARFDTSATLMNAMLGYGDYLKVSGQVEEALKQATRMEQIATHWLKLEGREQEVKAFLYIALDRQIEIDMDRKKYNQAIRKLEEKIGFDTPRERFSDLMRLARFSWIAGDRTKALQAAEEAARHDKTAIEATQFLESVRNEKSDS